MERVIFICQPLFFDLNVLFLSFFCTFLHFILTNVLDAIIFISKEAIYILVNKMYLLIILSNFEKFIINSIKQCAYLRNRLCDKHPVKIQI